MKHKGWTCLVLLTLGPEAAPCSSHCILLVGCASCGQPSFEGRGNSASPRMGVVSGMVIYHIYREKVMEVAVS